MCGLTGMKTTYGVLSLHGVVPLSRTLDSVGPLTHTARDAALLIAAMAGTDPRDPATASAPPFDLKRALAIDDRNPNLQALMRGAVMYVGINPWEGIEDQVIALPGGLQPMPGQSEAYRTRVDGRDLVFVPYYAVDTERTATYFKTA